MGPERINTVNEGRTVRLRGTDQHGMTLVELLAVLSLMGVLVIFAFVQLPPLVAQIRLDSGARQVVADLQVARMRAIAQNRRFRVTFHSDTHDYVVDKEEGGAWTRLVLHGHSSESAVDAFVALPASVTIAAVNSGGDVIFVPRGHVDGGISITLGSLAGAGTRRIIVNLAGRVRIE
jgi:prepilin-type N-terminal cleavage/methylation domain-containing protein